MTHVERVPARPARYAEWPSWADKRVIDRFRALGIERPWIHQAEAAQLLRRGHNVVQATGTASGKSLGYLLPALTDLLDGVSDAPGVRGPRRTTALYLAPTKALAADQARRIRELRLPIAPAACLDGDTTPEERRWIRDQGVFALSNPDMVHYALLPDHRRWSPFLRRLRYVVIDECHAYRGVLGSHVAAVLRRLRRVCAHYGASPVFALASATTAEPQAAAERLIGLPVDAVVDDGSPHGEVLFALWEPPLTDRRGERGAPVRRSAIAESAGLLADLVRDEVRTVAFVRSRRGAELVSLIARQQLGQADGSIWPAEAVPVQTTADLRADGSGTEDTDSTNSDGSERQGSVLVDQLSGRQAAAGSPGAHSKGRSTDAETAVPSLETDDEARSAERAPLASRIAAYRSGYLREDRRALEADLLSGRLLGVAATNALELGVDLSGLDAVLLTGYPGTRSSVWQQAGRAGRSGRDALAVMVARDDPLDTYLVHHPEALFGKSVESTVLNPGNPYVLWSHLCAAAAELPLTKADLDLFGPTTEALAAELSRTGWLRAREGGWFWTRPERAADLTDLRGSGGTPVRIVEAATGRLLGQVDAAAAHSTVHEGAVYLHQGDNYVVESLDLDGAIAVVNAKDPGYSTHARDTSLLRITGEERTELWSDDVRLSFGAVEVTNQVVGYLRRDAATGAVLGEEPLDLPARRLATKAVWWTMSPASLAAAELAAPDIPGAAHAAEHAAIGLLPLFAQCDRWDIGGLSTACHPDTGLPTVFVHDGLPGGGGFAERGFQQARAWLGATRDAIAACECPAGCPSCVQSPKCGNGNQPLDKNGAIRLLGVLLDGR
ncbi:DEAD/DEAH box helicase [Actinocrinis sp.]|uniref:DEAD/DEAH box helicase n=1 Tax=Actinocrinis sp. TaxID=1920516 RepID=UPI002D401F80|nr:DEAD/DEAH box helicase [Actinocrinis sp.]HZP53327.1 DEAD/DEAH box helicase [Actinocrinis sp.]